MATLNFPAPGDSTPGDKIQTGDIEWIYSAKGFWYSEVGGGVAGGASVSIGTTPPTNPSPEAGDLWWNSSEDSGRMFVYTGSEWTESSPQGAGGEGGGIGEAPNDGQQYARQNQDWSVITGGSGDTTINYSGAAAWAFYDATDGIKGNLNVASIVENSTGQYTVTFDTPMPNSDYSVQVTTTNQNPPIVASHATSQKTPTEVIIQTRSTADNSLVSSNFSIAVFATNALPPRGGTGSDAWATTNSDGTVPASFNIASCTRTNNGQYDYTFSTPMPNDSYAVVATSENPTSGRFCTVRNKTTTGFTVYVWNSEDQGVNGANGMHSVVVHATNAQLPDTISQEELDSLLDMIENPPSGYGGPSAWGQVDPDGSKVGAGLNFTCTLRDASTGIYDIVFDNPMPSDDYSIQATALSSNEYTAVAGGKTATGFLVRTFRDGTGLSNIGFTFTVHASNATPPRGGTGADAWCSTSVDGTVPASFNIASVTRAGTGLYDYVFSTPMPNIAYTVVVSPAGGAAIARTCAVSNKVETGFRIEVKNLEGSNANESHYVVVHATNAQLPDTITQEELDAALNSPGVSAWGAVDEAGGKIGSGLNFSTSTLSTNPGVYQVTFVTPMPSNQYSVTATPLRNDPGARYCTTGDLTTTGFTVRCFREVGLINSGFHFAVHATNAPPPKGGTGADAWATVLGTGDLSGGFNIASTTQVSTGVYELTFTSPMPSADYAVVASSLTVGENFCGISNKTTTSFRVNINSITGDPIDRVFHAVVHATNAQLPNTVTQEQIDNALSNSCAAWGSVANTGAILDSLNIASVAKDTDGSYTVTFATPMPNANYAVTADVVQTSAQPSAINFKNKTATGFEVIIRKVNDESLIDKAFTFAVFATNAPAPKGGTGADAWSRTNSTGDIHSSYNLTCVKAGAGVYQLHLQCCNAKRILCSCWQHVCYR